jgi:hypothetical protein
VESATLLRFSFLFILTCLVACDSSIGSEYPDCSVTRESQVSFTGLDSNDRLSLTIKGSPCYEASLSVSITSDTGKVLYEYKSKFKPLVAAQWDDSDLDEDAEILADRFVDPAAFGLTNELPEWLPESDYYEANYQKIQISREDYEQLRLKRWVTYTHPIHYEGWRVVAFDPENQHSIVVSEGTL